MSFPLETLPVSPDDMDSMDAYTLMPQLMTLMKNTLIRGMNNVHRIAGTMTPLHPNLKEYLQYVDQYCQILTMHLQGDQRFFAAMTVSGKPLTDIVPPACNPSTREFQVMLQHLRTLVQGFIKEPERFSGSSLRNLLVFAPKMAAQMKEQIYAIQTADLGRHCASGDLIAMIQDSIHWFGRNTDITFMVPFILSHHDPATSSHWPPVTTEGQLKLPGLLEVHKEVWQFAPFDPTTRAARAWSLNEQQE